MFLVAFPLMICVIATAATSPSRRLRVESPKEGHTADNEGFQSVDHHSMDNKAEDVSVVDLKDGRKILQEEGNTDDKSSMKEEDYKQVILDLSGQIQERDATIEERDATIEERDATIEERDTTIEERDTTIEERDARVQERDARVEELLDELQMKELNRRPDLQGDHVEPVLRFAWKFVLLMQASSESLERKEKKAESLVIRSNDFLADHLARHTFLDDTIPKRVAAMQNQYKSQQDSHSQFATLKGVSGSFISSRAGLHRPRPIGDGLDPQEMVSMMHGLVRYIRTLEYYVCLTPSLFDSRAWNEWTQVTLLVNSTDRRPPGTLPNTSIPQKRWTWTRMRVVILITRESRVINTSRLQTTRNCRVVASIPAKAFTSIPALCSEAEAALVTFRHWADVVLLTNHRIGRCSVDRATAKVVDLDQRLHRLKLLTHASLTLSRLMKVVKPSFQVVTMHAKQSSMCVLAKTIIVSFGNLIALLFPGPTHGILRLVALVL